MMRPSGSAPTATMESGQISRTSSTNGAPWARATGQPAQPAKNCGLVAMTTSARGRTSGPAAPAAARYER